MNIEKIHAAKCFLFDMDGTIFLGKQLIQGAKEFIDYLTDHQVPYYFLTNNSSRSRQDYVTKLEGMGLPTPAEKIFSSGEATAIYLQKQKKDARVFLVGTPSLENEFKRFGFDLVQEDPDFAVLGFDTTLTYNKIWKLCDFITEGVPYIATHPDINCPLENGFMPDIGAMMAMIAASTGKNPDVIVGKPHAPIVKSIIEKTGFKAAEIVMVGDRLYTDIALGEAGLTTVLVLSGETKGEDIPASPFQPDFVVEHVGQLFDLYRQ